MIVDLVALLIENIEMLIALSAISQILSFYDKKYKFQINIYRGLLFGLVGLFIMTFPYKMAPGITFDTRSILLSITALMFGWIPAVISSGMMIIYRIIMGGSGMIMGILVIISSTLIGLNWSKIKIVSSYRGKAVDFYLMGLMVHVVMIICMFTLPFDRIFITMKAVGIPVLILYPLVTVILGKLFNFQLTQMKDQQDLKEAEIRFRSIFNQAPTGIGYATMEGVIMEVNDEYASMQGYTIDEIKNMPIDHTTYPDDLVLQVEKMQEIRDGLLKSFSMDKRYISKNGNLLWANLSVSKVRFTQDQPEHLMMIVQDITEEKEYELVLEHIAYHDQLTHCYNGRYYEEFIEKQVQDKDFPISLILVNVNGLKTVNEIFGHKAGDNLLKTVADTLKRTCEESTMIARVSSNEFLVLHKNQNDNVLKFFETSINFAIDQQRIEGMKISVSMGCAVWNHPDTSYRDIFKLVESRMLNDKVVAKNSMLSKTIDIIINSLFEKNNREMLHSKRVSIVCEKLAQKMDFDQKNVDKIKIAGLMHDIGKIGISDEILNKSGKLDEHEWNQIKRHSDAGYRILSSAIEFSEIAECVLTHHERWDGKGYPKGLIGTDIPLFSRIIAVADAFDAMTSERTYRQALSIEKVIDEMKTNAGKQFDPQIVDLFIANIDEFKAIL
ncbi:MAG: diguanylate cyclase/phosphodiesterase (GGDEF & EAL domains) with PAS/PAC sensor(s) [Erysipelotrichaceae bacterium]|nr:MAG: diguanylate cyclase/phosphodiesterase (GGDEF & EAL domains) with PAS/PAC [Erysipelotrichaceae bacterium]TXT16719.1 MAG: diguanylate cyclase/phosphodiesterase (GGDEF & EAL domains) with PAS/PAC sensor(s) [Erysipelotrichaceae bacterium]